MMTRKHFEQTAAIIKAARSQPQHKAVEYIARQLAVDFADDNPNFDRDRFLTACGIKS